MHKHHPISLPWQTYALLALIFWLPLPLGSNRGWAWAIAEVWVFLLGLSILLAIYRGKASIPHTVYAAKPLILLLLSTVVWIGIQILPMPLSWLSFISPHAAEIHLLATSDVGFATISLSPHTTAIALLKSIMYFMIMLITLMLIDSQTKLRWLAFTILGGGLFQSAYGSFMVLSGIEYTFFIEKVDYLGLATGTFINRNHLAGYLEMSLAVGIGLLISSLGNHHLHSWRARMRHLLDTLLSPKAIIRLVLIFICVGLILTRSRMGNSAFFISLLLTGILFLITARHATKSTVYLLTSLIILDVMLIGSWVGIDKVVERLEETTFATEHRDEVVRDSMILVSDYPITGTGAGTYFTAFQHYQGQDIWSYYDHAHNDYLELLSELGIVGFSLLALCVLYCLYCTIIAMQRRRSPLMLGMAFASFMGMISILIHSSVDFNLQIPANAAMFIIIMTLSVISLRLDKHHHITSKTEPGTNV